MATLGEGKILTSGVKALVQGADKLLMKNLAETAIVKEGVQVAKSNAVSQSAKVIEKSAANEAKQAAGSTSKQLIEKAMAGDSTGSATTWGEC